MTEPSSPGTVTGTHAYTGDGSFTVTVTVSDDDGGAGNDTFKANVGRPSPPALIAPVDETSPLDPTFRWLGDGLSQRYRLQITTDNDFVTPDHNVPFANIPHDGAPGIEQVRLLSSITTGGIVVLSPATLYQWRVRAKNNDSGLTGDFSLAAEFITTGPDATAVLSVSLEAPGTADDPVRFDVKLYDKTGFDPASPTPWDLFGQAPLIQFIAITGSRAGQTFTITLPPTIPVGFYDITVEANHTLVNVKNNVAIAQNTGTIDMGTLLEGNGIDDSRGAAVEPGSLVNALDASLLATAISTQAFNPDVDFNRDGLVDPPGGGPDLALLTANYLRFSPIPV